MKFPSDKSFFEFLKTKKSSPLWILPILALALLLIGGFGAERIEDVSNMEEKTAEMCSMLNGVGECRVMMTYSEESGEVFAVAIFCEGAESVEVRRDLTELICSLYGIGAHRVTILRLN